MENALNRESFLYYRGEIIQQKYIVAWDLKCIWRGSTVYTYVCTNQEHSHSHYQCIHKNTHGHFENLSCSNPVSEHRHLIHSSHDKET